MASLKDEVILLKRSNTQLTDAKNELDGRLEVQEKALLKQSGEKLALKSELDSLKLTMRGLGVQESEDQKKEREEVRAKLDSIDPLNERLAGLEKVNSDLSRALEAAREPSSNICPRCQKRDQDEAHLREVLQKANQDLHAAKLEIENMRNANAKKDEELELLQKQVKSEQQKYKSLLEQVEAQLGNVDDDVVMAGNTPEEAHAANQPPPRPVNPSTPKLRESHRGRQQTKSQDLRGSGRGGHWLQGPNSKTTFERKFSRTRA